MIAHKFLLTLVEHFARGSRKNFLLTTGMSTSYIAVAKNTKLIKLNQDTLQKIESAYGIVIIIKNGEYTGWKSTRRKHWLAVTDRDAVRVQVKKLKHSRQIDREINAIVRQANRKIEKLIGLKF
jgi:hypothetical protein